MKATKLQNLKTKLTNVPPTEEYLRQGLPGRLDAIKMLSNEAMVAVATGQVDMSLLAREFLADRGFNFKNEWVGFERARKENLNGQHVVIESEE